MNYNFRKQAANIFGKISFLAIVIAFCASNSEAVQTDSFANGVAAYNKGWYSTALYYFTLAEKQNPNNALIHYYLGNTLVHQNYMSLAMNEYNYTVELDANGLTGKYAREALQAAGYARSEGDTKLLPDQDVVETQKALMNKAEELGQHSIQHAAAKASDRLQEGTRQGTAIREEEERVAGNMQRSGSWLTDAHGRNTVWVPTYSADQIAAYREQKEREADAAIYAGNSDYKSIADHAVQRATNISDSASGLAQQLAAPLVGDDARLSPQGTNLYVRNYIVSPRSPDKIQQATTPQLPIDALSAKSKKLQRSN